MAPSDPVTHERVYKCIRRDILDGTIKPGSRLAATDLARRLEASVTPVREAMYRLVGEGLISSAQSGFHASVIDEGMLLDVIDASQKLLIIGLQRLSPDETLENASAKAGEEPDAEQATDMLETALSYLFRSTKNGVIIGWGERTVYQLHVLRLGQCLVSQRARQEGQTLLKLAAMRDRTRLARQILAHHRRLRQAVVFHQAAIASRLSRDFRG
ncbi:DNA-binding transcriptional regulator, GntR family [Sphingobium sp. AP50]|uniref:GntR family transcriptional regulator n=1 Tax=Sphingobium sp. AP50 TaxID=1884369 RepID=UPI0008D5EDF1|nr:GntR family transcriptional regulator [Sphingobium sp. AP50]SEJ46442.1 DNA-binding transcriptional regulator, GntR family [Sphingobium sp. AP50]